MYPEMSSLTAGSFHIWMTYALVIVAILGFAIDRIKVEITALVLLVALLLMFELIPLRSPDGKILLDTKDLLAGFANPALIAVLALLVLGNGLWRAGALDWVIKQLFQRTGKSYKGAIFICFVAVFIASPFVNNTPVVVIFIPILETIVQRFSKSPSSVMMSLSFIAILAGMTTLVGSSTNLLVSGTMVELGQKPLEFFGFFVPGLVLASVGLMYLWVATPYLLPRRSSPAQRFMSGNHRRFITQFTVGNETKLIGARICFNLLSIRGARLILVLRGEQRLVPPYQDLEIHEGDTLIVMGTHDALAEAQTKFPKLIFATSGKRGHTSSREEKALLANDQVVVEIMVAPGSQLVGQSIEEANFRSRYGCLVLGVEQHSRITRILTGRTLLEGDVLVVQGDREVVERMRKHSGVVVLDGTARPLPGAQAAKMAGAIFVGVVLLSVSGLLPIAAAAVFGVMLMLLTGVLTLEQAVNSLDRQIYLMVGASLALGLAMLKSGAAAYLADGVIGLIGNTGPAVILSMLFLLIAILTNVLSNNATAILFTPVSIELATGLDADPMPFALAVLFGANCSFATPIGYQTNLLVMGPGYYRFSDFARVGLPLIVILWATFSIFMPWYYGF